MRKGGARNWMVREALPRFVSDFIIMRTRAVVRRANWKNGITSNHWPSLPRIKPQREKEEEKERASTQRSPRKKITRLRRSAPRE